MLILDEPTRAGLDPVGRRQMRDHLRGAGARNHVLFCSHIIPDVEALCDRLAVLVGGRRVREGSVRELVSAQVPNGGDGHRRAPAGGEVHGPDLMTTCFWDGRVRVQVSDAQSQRMLSQVIAAGARQQPPGGSVSLEHLFMDASRTWTGDEPSEEINT